MTTAGDSARAGGYNVAEFYDGEWDIRIKDVPKDEAHDLGIQYSNSYQDQVYGVLATGAGLPIGIFFRGLVYSLDGSQ